MPDNNVYLDHASTSPLRPEAKEAMAESFELLGDPSRIHQDGIKTRHAIENAREQVAEFVGAKPREVVFTSGATEAIAAATFGVMAKNPDGKILTSAVEHSCVLETSQQFSHQEIGVDEYGVLDIEEFTSVLSKDAKNISLVSIQQANHEIGTLQDIDALLNLSKKENAGVFFHIDAAQSIGHIPFNFAKSQIDLVSISGHKFGAPKGIGALLVKQGLRIEPLLKGGNQERARRGGLENSTAIVGFGAVCAALSDSKIQAEAKAAQELTQKTIELCCQIEGITHYGHPTQRAPHIACFGFSDVEPQAILLDLDRKGISVHSGSACASEDLEPSSVLTAIGVDANRSLRVSVGWNSTEQDIQAFGAGLKESLDYLRGLK